MLDNCGHNGHSFPPAEPIELKGILRESDQFFVVFACGESERIVEAELSDILPFDNFHRLMLDRFDQRVVYRRGQWLHDVAEAAKRGGAPIAPEAFSRATRIGEASMPTAASDFLAEIMASSEVQEAIW